LNFNSSIRKFGNSPISTRLRGKPDGRECP
jgi:hypothetical protein